tara:strand:+ start:805 stop:1482 length:678 start_codon:yes stop_codon:yes gene_type:complete
MNLNSQTILLTFGDSWVTGEGAGYTKGMTQIRYDELFKRNEDICWEKGWRKKVVDHFDIDHLNFSTFDGSNTQQFQLAKEFFISKKFQELTKTKDNIIILWGITSLKRDSSQLKNLEIDILHWNQYLKLLNKGIGSTITNFWFDTFKSKEYGIKISNFIGIESSKRDLLSLLCLNFNGTSNQIGTGFEYAERNKLIDPYTYHPRPEQHSVIADYFINHLKRNARI